MVLDTILRSITSGSIQSDKVVTGVFPISGRDTSRVTYVSGVRNAICDAIKTRLFQTRQADTISDEAIDGVKNRRLELRRVGRSRPAF